ncbi:MAG TPA: hypothetical protein VFC87_06695 [Perlabentimonas sp.]|nr:hypothetical protein [Bacteroidales bacterium]MDD4671878.1 hypothetical protein [Bacteroidales bacterium]MDY0349162.1 hypothetical protein [Tenuifilaceae bacterium]HZJ74476.1 hypothetical protein [Perlabentimonas sp.]
MQNKLQELTEKIYKEGLTKGTEEANQMVSKAKDDAAKIVGDAQKQAEQIVAQAKKEAEDLKKNVNTEVSISTRQVVSALKQDVSSIIEAKIIDSPITDALKDTDFVKSVIEAAIKNWNPESTERVSLRVLIPKKTEKEFDEFLKSKVFSTLNKELEVVADKSMKYGFKIGPKDGSYIISFTEKDFENLFKEYMRPRILELLLENE